jgi:hypothetical protein
MRAGAQVVLPMLYNVVVFTDCTGVASGATCPVDPVRSWVNQEQFLAGLAVVQVRRPASLPCSSGRSGIGASGMASIALVILSLMSDCRPAEPGIAASPWEPPAACLAVTWECQACRQAGCSAAGHSSPGALCSTRCDCTGCVPAVLAEERRASMNQTMKTAHDEGRTASGWTCGSAFVVRTLAWPSSATTKLCA